MNATERHHLVRYARRHGLISDEEPQDILTIALETCGPHSLEVDQYEIPEISFAPWKNEKLSLPRNGALFLRNLFADQGPVEPMLDLERHNQSKRLKLEQPLLRTDHEFDVQDFLNLREEVPLLANTPLEPIQLNEENDEGLSWSMKNQDLPKQLDAQLKNEKLEVSSNGLSMLASILKPGSMRVDLENAISEDLKHKRVLTRELTPPLIASPCHKLDPASSPLDVLESPIEYPSSIPGELEELRERISRQDEIEVACADHDHPNEGMNDSRSPNAMIDKSPTLVMSTSPAPAQDHSKAWNLKMEGPLTSPMAPVPPKPVSFSDIAEEIKPFMSPTVNQPTISDDEMLDELFKEVIEPSARKVKFEVEHEQLHAADSTLRMDVPPLDMTIPDPPWIRFFTDVSQFNDAQPLLLPISKMKLHHWPGVGKLELNMPWAPFPSNLGKVALQEPLGDPKLTSKFLDVADYGNALDVNSLVWKPDSLRILDEGDDEDEIMSTLPLDSGSGMGSLVRKRKEILDHLSPREISSKTIDSVRVLDGKAPPQEGQHRQSTSFFSVSDELSKFMETQGQVVKRPKLATGSFSAPAQNDLKISATATKRDEQNEKPDQETASDTEAYPCPVVPIPDNSRTIIVSSKFMSRRNLIRAINGLWPTLNFVERDWASIGRKKDERSIDEHDEGDVITSPAQTVICTTIAKICQKPLPGQRGDSFVRTRLRTVAKRFEQVTVLVEISDGFPIDQHDQKCEKAMTDLINFGTSLPAQVFVYFVAGSEADFAKFMVSTIAASNTVRSETKLLEEETLWELFLRRAGLNTYAAQAILGELKPPESGSARTTLHDTSEHGLVAFLSMSRSTRIDYFEELMGGQRILSQLSHLLDARWLMGKEMNRKPYAKREVRSTGFQRVFS